MEVKDFLNLIFAKISSENLLVLLNWREKFLHTHTHTKEISWFTREVFHGGYALICLRSQPSSLNFEVPIIKILAIDTYTCTERN